MANTKPPMGKRFEKGNKANPLGAGAHNPILRAVKRMTQAEVAEVGSLLLDGNLEKLAAVKDDRDASVLKVWMCSIAITAIKKGDAQALNALLDRIVGKSKETVHITTEVSKLSDDELKARIKNLQMLVDQNSE